MERRCPLEGKNLLERVLGLDRVRFDWIACLLCDFCYCIVDQMAVWRRNMGASWPGVLVTVSMGSDGSSGDPGPAYSVCASVMVVEEMYFLRVGGGPGQSAR